MPKSRKIAIAADHAGFQLKVLVAGHLREKGYDVLDLGTDNAATRVDYPDFGQALGAAVAEGRASLGVAICGSGIGIAIALNRNPKIRAAVCHDMTTARFARSHNDANVIALGERFIGTQVAFDCVDAFLDTAFEGGRHEGRVNKLGGCGA